MAIFKKISELPESEEKGYTIITVNGVSKKFDLNKLAEKSQYVTMPDATQNAGKIIQYVGETTVNYTKGMFYVSTDVEPGVYGWLPIFTNVNADWSENDENSKSYVQNRTHWEDSQEVHKLNDKFINETIARKTYVDDIDQNLQEQIDAITSSTDVRDVVGTYAELLAYDTSVLFNNDVIKVLVDENKNNAISYYRWVITEGVGTWSYIGSQGPFYTKAESDVKYVPKTTTVNGKALSNDITLTKSDVGLSNVDNTSDLNKPISTATQTALNAKADDTNVLHKTGAETASGVKTFSDGIKIASVGVQYDTTNECIKFVFN